MARWKFRYAICCGWIVTSTALCGNTATETINILNGSTPTVDAGTEVSIEEGTDFPIDATTSNGDTYSWTPVEGLSCADCEDPIASPEETTTYYLTVTSSDGCSATDSIIITILQNEEIWWPNAISGTSGPDCCFGFTGDNLNDYYLRIYNRWGELIFESRDQAELWNGTFRGKDVQTGVYTFVMDYTDIQDEAQVIGGNITVVK